MKLLTRQARLTCKHLTGELDILRYQNFVTIEGNPILRWPDPEYLTITGCPNAGATIKPCTLSLPVYKGYSGLVFIEGLAVCLDTVTGLTDGTPPGTVEYIVRDPGNSFVSEE